MKDDELLEKLEEIVNKRCEDWETPHRDSDYLLCEILKQHGYEKSADFFIQMMNEWWYS